MEIKKLELSFLDSSVKSHMIDMGMSYEDFKREAMFACEIWNNPKNSYLRKATSKSLLTAIINIAQVGLTLNPIAKEAAIVPRKNGDVIEAHLEPMYGGLVKLLTDSGSVINIISNLIYEGDNFTVDLITGQRSHIPHYVTGKEQGKIKGVYAIARLHDGSDQFEHMTAEEVFAIRDRSESYKAYKAGKASSSIWITDEGEMFRKTVIKRIYKYLPKSQKSEKLQRAIELTDRDYVVSGQQFEQITKLLPLASIPDDQKDDIERELPSMTWQRANEVIFMLRDNQLDPIESGAGYSQADIHRKLDQIENNDRK